MTALHFFGALVVAASTASLVACSPVRATAATTTTAADVSSLAGDRASERSDRSERGERGERIEAPVAREATPAAEADVHAPVPAGQLVCRAKSVVDGTTEVFLDWNGNSAKGTLRHEAPSGMVYVQRVEAERADSLIIVDEPSNDDLMSHAAVIGKHDGKTLIRIGAAGQPWLTCE